MCERCDIGLPSECPCCEVIILGATEQDWYEHFEEDCDPLGTLYCFAGGTDGS